MPASRAGHTALCRAVSSFASTNAKDIQDEFTRQATTFEIGWDARCLKKTGEIMDFVWEQIAPYVQQDARALDVACGTGIFARYLASSGKCKSVTGIDITTGMLDKALDAAREEGRTIHFVHGDCADMGIFEDNSFDAVVTRLSVHHFADPRIQLAEMARVCKPGGAVAICDIISVDDPEEAAEHNRLEILRDPSHTRMLPAAELVALVADSGLSVQSSASAAALDVPIGASFLRLPYFDNYMRMHEWLDSTRTPPAARATVERSLQIELNKGTKTGMLPFLLPPGPAEEQGEVCFTHRYVVCVGVKEER